MEGTKKAEGRTRRGAAVEGGDEEGDDPMMGTQESVGDSALQAELDAIVHGTHAGMASELVKHRSLRDARVALATRRRDEEVRNAKAISDCDLKRAEDTFAAHVDELKERLCDAVYARYFKTNPHAPQPLHQHQLAAAASSKRARKPPPLSHCAITAAQRRRLLPPVQIAYALSEGEVEDDLEFLLAEAEKDKARALTAGARADADATRADEGSEEDGYEVTYDKASNTLFCGDHSFERWSAVAISDRAAQGSAVVGDWCVTALGPLEVTLRNIEGARTKVSLASLRSRRLEFIPLGTEP